MTGRDLALERRESGHVRLMRGAILVLAGSLAACSATSPSGDPSPGAASPASPPSASPTRPSPAIDPTPPPSAAPPSPSAQAAAQRIEIPGGPLGLDIADGHAWVVATDGGQLVDVDLATGATTPMEVGSSANWVKVLDDGRLVISRYGTAPGRATLEIIDPADGTVTPVAQDPIDALDVDGGTIWAFEKGGTVLRVDPDGRIVGQAEVEITENEHIDLVGPARPCSRPRTARRSGACAAIRWRSTRPSRPAAACRSSATAASSGAPAPTSCGRSTRRAAR